MKDNIEKLDLSNWNFEGFKRSLKNLSMIKKLELFKFKEEQLNTLSVQFIEADSKDFETKNTFEELFNIADAEKTILALSIAEHLTKD